MKPVTVLLDDDLPPAIDGWCHENDRSFSEAVRHALRLFFLPATDEAKAKKGRPVFEPPTIEEIRSHIIERGYSFEAESFFGFYESKGWRVGNQPMRSWKAACVTWEKRRAERKSLNHPPMYTGASNLPESSEEERAKNRAELEQWERENLPKEQWRVAR